MGSGISRRAIISPSITKPLRRGKCSIAKLHEMSNDFSSHCAKIGNLMVILPDAFESDLKKYCYQ